MESFILSLYRDAYSSLEVVRAYLFQSDCSYVFLHIIQILVVFGLSTLLLMHRVYSTYFGR